jgi:hypothetical protein
MDDMEGLKAENKALRENIQEIEKGWETKYKQEIQSKNEILIKVSQKSKDLDLFKEELGLKSERIRVEREQLVQE